MLDVIDWKSEPTVRIIDENGTYQSYAPSAVIGWAGSIVLHLVILQAVFLGIYLPKQPSKVAQPVAGPGSAKEMPANLILIRSAALPKSQEFAWSVAASLRIRPEKFIQDIQREALPSMELNLLAIEEEDQPESTEDRTTDARGRRLQGIYSGQMQARIERLWRRPRSPVSNNPVSAAATDPDDDYFQCQVQILQDNQGNVQEVLLPSCNGSAAWQRSLVVAIQQSSPLPAPPDASVFSRTVALQFIAYAYRPGSSEDGYE